MKAVLLCLATKKGFEVLRAASVFKGHRAFHVATFKETHVVESYDDDIRELALGEGLPLVRWKEFRDDPVGFLARRNIGAILCIGWRYLIPEVAVRHVDGEVVIAHDSVLPKLRGFAPLVTAMITGETTTGVTFLRSGTEVDNGDILWQKTIPIGPNDRVADLIDRLIPLYVQGARLWLLGELREGTPQDDSQATYSLWRGVDDYRINWSEDAARIERTIRALGPPYLGARSTLGDTPVVIHDARVVPDLPFAIRQPGKIWRLDHGGRPTVVCGSGMLEILSATAVGRVCIPLKALRASFV
jgi:methionyl-tRNA formyltransferase